MGGPGDAEQGIVLEIGRGMSASGERELGSCAERSGTYLLTQFDATRPNHKQWKRYDFHLDGWENRILIEVWIAST